MYLNRKNSNRSRFWTCAFKSKRVDAVCSTLNSLEPTLEYAVIGSEKSNESLGQYHDCVLIFKERHTLAAIPPIFREIKCERILFVGKGERRLVLQELLYPMCLSGVLIEKGVSPISVSLSDPPKPQHADKTYIEKPFYSLRELQTIINTRFSITATDYCLHFKEPPPFPTIVDFLRYTTDVLHEVIADATSGFSSDDIVQLSLRSDQLNHPIGLPFMPKNKLNGERLLKLIEHVVQSDETFSLDGNFLLQINRSVLPEYMRKQPKESLSEESYDDLAEFSTYM